MTDVKDVPTEPLAPRSLPAEAIDALLRAAATSQNAILRARDEALLALLIYAGLRVQEVCDLQLRDLDLGSGTITVRSGKAGKARRLSLHLDAERLLRRYLESVRCPEGLPEVQRVLGHSRLSTTGVYMGVRVRRICGPHSDVPVCRHGSEQAQKPVEQTGRFLISEEKVFGTCRRIPEHPLPCSGMKCIRRVVSWESNHGEDDPSCTR